MIHLFDMMAKIGAKRERDRGREGSEEERDRKEYRKDQN